MTIRLFTTHSITSLVSFQAQLLSAGFTVNPVGTNQLDVFYRDDASPFTVDLSTANQSITRETISSFIEAIAQLPASNEQAYVLDTLSRTQSLIIIGEPEDYDEADAHTQNAILDGIAALAEGMFQIDAVGFYLGSSLILEWTDTQ